MNINELQKICCEVAKNASTDSGFYQNLIYAQTRPPRRVIREPEIRDIFCRTLTVQNIIYGIEVPTKGKYRFVDTSGDRKARARIDLAIYDCRGAALDDKQSINIEFKTDQPPYKQIEKDFQKFMRENVKGICFFHVLQNANSGTLPTLIKKYAKAYKQARNRVNCRAKWLLLFIFVRETRLYYYARFQNICSKRQVDFGSIGGPKHL